MEEAYGLYFEYVEEELSVIRAESPMPFPGFSDNTILHELEFASEIGALDSGIKDAIRPGPDASDSEWSSYESKRRDKDAARDNYYTESMKLVVIPDADKVAANEKWRKETDQLAKERAVARFPIDHPAHSFL